MREIHFQTEFQSNYLFYSNSNSILLRGRDGQWLLTVFVHGKDRGPPYRQLPQGLPWGAGDVVPALSCSGSDSFEFLKHNLNLNIKKKKADSRNRFLFITYCIFI